MKSFFQIIFQIKNKREGEYMFPFSLVFNLKWLNINLVAVIAIVLLQTSCYEPTEGCLDIEATNFDASADEQCESCCTYPELKLSIFHAIETQSSVMEDSCIFFSATADLTNNDSINFFQIKNMYYYLSDFRLTLSTGEIVQVSDSIQLNILDNAVTFAEKDTLVVDDFLLIKRTAFTYTIGEFIAPGNYEKIQFKVGLNTRLNTTNPDTLDSSHPLARVTEVMHTGPRSSGYILQKFEVVRDTMSLPDSYSYEILDPFSNTIEISLDYPFELSPGFDATLPIKVNYSKWLSGIDFVTDDDATIKSKIVTNTAEAFSISD